MNIKSFLKQTASYKIGTGDGYGGISHGTATTVNVRWVSKFELIRDAKRKEVVSKAVVITENLLAIDGHLTLTGGASDQEGIIIAIGSVPSVDGSQTLNKVWIK